MDFNERIKKWLKKDDTPPQKDTELHKSEEPEKIEDIEHLIKARERALDDMRELERKIKSERESWTIRHKEREEERISFEAQIELLEKRAFAEKQKREMELNLSEGEAVKQLKRLEKQLETETAIWSKRLEDKESELKDENNKKSLIEAQYRLEEERKKQEYGQEIQVLNRDVESKERHILEQRAQLLQRLKQQDEANVQLRTQLSLRETQLQMEWDSREQEIKKLQEDFENRQKALLRELSSKSKSWEQQLRLKEAEIGSLKSAIEQKKMSLTRDQEEVERKLNDESNRVRERIDLLKKSISNESASWSSVLKSREDEFNQLKMKLMLEETQEKSDWAKKKAEIAGLSSKARSKIEFLEQKIREQEDKFKVGLQKNEETYETLKIQGALQSQELETQRQKKLEGQQTDKVKLENRITELQKDIENNKKYWNDQLELKDKEIAEFRENLRRTIETDRVEREEQLSVLSKEKEDYANRVKSLEEEMVRERLQWKKESTEKEKQLMELEGVINGEKRQTENKLDQLEKDFYKKHKPLFNKLEFLQDEISLIQHKAKEAVEEKDRWMELFKRQTQRQEEIKASQFDEERNVFELERKNLEQRMHNLTGQKQDEVSRYQGILKDREEQVLRLKDTLKSNQESDKKKIEHILQSLLDKKTAVEKDAGELNIKLEEERGRFNAFLEQKNREKSELEEDFNNRLREHEEKRKGMESLWESEKALLDGKIKELENDKMVVSEEWQSQINEKDSQVKEYIGLIEKERTSNRERMIAEQSSFEKAMKPLDQEKERIATGLELQRGEWDTRVKSLDNTIKQLNSEKNSKDRLYSKKIIELTRNIEEEKQRLNSQILEIKRTKASYVKESKSFMEAKQLDLASKKEELENAKEESRNDFGLIIKEHHQVIEGTKVSIKELSLQMEDAQRRWPEVIEAKKNELKKLHQDIAYLDSSAKNNQDEHNRSMESVRSELSSKLARHEQELHRIQRENEEKAAFCDNKIKRINEEFQYSREEFQKSIDEENSRFSEEKYKLEKEKKKIEQGIRGEETRGQRDSEQKENQISDLKQFLEIKKQDGEEKDKRMKEHLEKEKSKFKEEELRLVALIDEEEKNVQKILQGKEDAIHSHKLSAEERLSKMKITLEERKRDREIFIDRLQSDLADQRDFWEKQKDVWAGKLQAKSEELDILKNEYSGWETERKGVEEEQRKQFEEDINRIKEDIHVLSLKLEKQKGVALQQIAVKEQHLKDLQGEYEKKEDDVRFRQETMEKSYLEEKEQMMMEMRTVEEKIRELEEGRGGKLKTLEQEIRKSQMELNEKKSRLELELKKGDRDFLKLKLRFEAKKKELEKELSSVSDRMSFQLKMKEEEISTLKMRVNLRRERLVSEWKRREESLKSIIEKLRSDLENMSQQEVFMKNDLTREFMVKEREFEILKEELADVTRQFESHREKTETEGSSAKVHYEKDIEKTEFNKSMSIKNLQIENKLKENEIKELGNELIFLEERINSEQDNSKDIYKQAFTRAEKLRKEFNSEVSSSLAKQSGISPARRNFEKGVKAYQEGVYDEAISSFQRALELDDSFTSAFHYLGLSYLHMNMIDKAIQFGEKAFEHDPENKVLEAWLEELKRQE